MLRTSRKAQLGLNLVELMIGLVVGLIVLAAVTTIYLNTSRGSRDTLNANRLNQDLRAVMDIMVGDIRRAGYWGTAASGKTNCFTLRATNAECAYLGANLTDIYISNLSANRDCILYSYDATYKDGDITGTAAAGTDFFGFKLDGGAIWMATNFGNTNQACTNNLGWERMTDPAVINIGALTFSTLGSKCLNATTGAAWTVNSSATAAACADASATGYVAPTLTTDSLAETRQITISITAGYIAPNGVADPGLTRTLTESVLVRNNRIMTP